jgi:exo-beta-1,3-glucanase (GH17 family)
MTYSPYDNDRQCKDADSVESDIATIASKGFSAVRLYSTDCSGLENVANSAVAHNLKLILGVFIQDSAMTNVDQQVSDIIKWGSAGNWGSVEMIVIGNEAIFGGFITASGLATYIGTAKLKFKAAGYSGPCTTTEPLNILQETGSTVLCAAIDVLGTNIHPFFNGGTVAKDAGTFVASQLSDAAKICPGMTVYNLETGWPHQGSANGDAVPSPENAKIAVAAIAASAGSKSAFLSFS